MICMFLVDAHPGCYNGETERLTATSGAMTTPFFETGYYPYDTQCSWLLVAPEGYVSLCKGMLSLLFPKLQ